VGRLRQAEDQLRAYSDRALAVEASLIEEGLALLSAAIKIASPPDTSMRRQAVIKLAQLQYELLWDGWKAVQEGRYAAAVNPIRIIYELSDYIAAAGANARGAYNLLHDKEWDINEARIAATAAYRSQAPEIWDNRLARRTAVYNHDFQQVAHTCWVLMEFAQQSAMADLKDGVTIYSAMHSLANAYTEFVLDAVFSVGLALNELLPDGGVWSNRQRDFMKRCGAYRDAHPIQTDAPAEEHTRETS
jgi:hypothetical protein